MSNYAVFNIKKPKGGLNSVAKHIERTHHPDNARAELSHLNRYDLIEYPPGVKTLAEAVEYRIATAGIGRKIGPNQVRCLTAVMTSDHEAMERIIAEGKFEGWIKDSVDWACERFGRENVVAAVLHMDEYTPHLHVVIVPIVTTERKHKPRESKAKRTYRTKPKNRPRLCADDVMTRDNLEHFHDEYAVPMKKYGLKRGIRGSMARHVDQHDYYRQCQREKESLEADVSKLTAEKKKLGREKKALETDKDKIQEETRALEADKEKLEKDTRILNVQKSQCEEYNLRVRKENGELTEQKDKLQAATSSLTARLSDLVDKHDALEESASKLEDEVNRMELQKMRGVVDTDLAKYKADIERYFPDLPDLLTWGRYCTHVGFPDDFTRRILSFENVAFSGSLFSSEHNQKYRTEYSEAKLERDPKEKHRFNLKIDGVSIFQWFRDQARKFLEKLGIRTPQPKPRTGIRR